MMGFQTWDAVAHSVLIKKHFGILLDHDAKPSIAVFPVKRNKDMHL